MGFLANGEFAEVMKILNYEERYGFRFADIEEPDRSIVERSEAARPRNSVSFRLARGVEDDASAAGHGPIS